MTEHELESRRSPSAGTTYGTGPLTCPPSERTERAVAPRRIATRGMRRESSSSDEDSTIGLLRALVADAAELVRKEATLVRVELAEKLEEARDGIVAIGAGALVAYAGLLVLCFAAVAGLNEWIDQPWLAALIVGMVVLFVGMALMARGRAKAKPGNLTPERSLRSMRKDAELVRDEVRRTT